jgi:hypothetical protein
MNTNALLNVAKELRRQADAIEMLVRESNDADDRVLTSHLDVIRQHCDDGVPEDEAIAAACALMGGTARDVRWAWNHSQTAEQREIRRSFPYRIADLTAAGLKDAEIARIIGIPRRQIDRIRTHAEKMKPKKAQEVK